MGLYESPEACKKALTLNLNRGLNQRVIRIEVRITIGIMTKITTGGEIRRDALIGNSPVWCVFCQFSL